MPYPQAASALIDGLSRISGLTLDASRFGLRPTRHACAWTNSSPTPRTRSMVKQLELAADRTRDLVGCELPSGDELAAELERFLRGEAN